MNQVCDYLPVRTQTYSTAAPLREGNRKKGASPANPPFLATDLQGWAATNWLQGVRKVWLYSPNGVGEVQCAGFSLSVSVSPH